MATTGRTLRISFSLDFAAFKRGFAEVRGMKIDIDVGSAQRSIDGLGDKAKKVGAEIKSRLKDAFTFAAGNVLGNVVGVLGQGLGNFVEDAKKFEDGLADVSAVTGLVGKELDTLGQKARTNAKEFGGSAAEQIGVFGSVISKFGPAIGNAPEALDAMGKTINTLGQASGEGAQASMESLTGAMLQFGAVDTSKPIETAKNMQTFGDILAAGAQEGSAGVKQTSDALLVAGVQLKGANVSFAESVATVQALGDAGLYGAEGGTALRSVISKLGEGRFLPADTQKELVAAGVNIDKLSDKSIPLSERLKELEKIQGDSALMTKFFGAEAAAAGSVLVQNTGKIEKLTEAVQKEGAAEEQAAKKRATFSQVLLRLQAVVADIGISLFQALGPLLNAVVGIVSRVADQLAPILISIGEAFAGLAEPLLAVVAPIISALGAILKPVIAYAGVVISVIGKVVAAIAPILETFTTIFAETFVGIIGPIYAALEGAIVPLADALAPLGQVIAELLGAVLPLVLQLNPFLIILRLIGAILPELLPPIVQIATSLLTLATTVLSALLPAISLLLPLITRLIQFLVGGLATGLGAVAGIIAQVAATIVSGLVTAITTLIGWIESAVAWVIDLGESIGEFLAPVLDLIVDLFTAIYDTIAGIVIPIFSKLFEWVGKIADFLSKVFVRAWNDLRSAADSTASFFTDTVLPILEDIWNAVMRAVNGVGEFIAGLARMTGVSAVFEAAMQIIGAAINAVTGFFSNLKVELAGIGATFGFVGGLIVDFVKALANLEFEQAFALFEDFPEKLYASYLNGKKEAEAKIAADAKKPAGVVNPFGNIKINPVGGIGGAKPDPPPPPPPPPKEKKPVETVGFDTVSDIEKRIAELELEAKEELDAFRRIQLQLEIDKLKAEAEERKKVEELDAKAAEARKQKKIVNEGELATAKADATRERTQAEIEAEIKASDDFSKLLSQLSNERIASEIERIKREEEAIEGESLRAVRARFQKRAAALTLQQEQERRKLIEALPEFQVERDRIGDELAAGTIARAEAERQLADLLVRFRAFNDDLRVLAEVQAKAERDLARETAEAIRKIRRGIYSEMHEQEKQAAIAAAEDMLEAELQLIAAVGDTILALREELANREGEVMVRFLREINEARTDEEREAAIERRDAAMEAIREQLGDHAEYERLLGDLRQRRVDAEARAAKAVRDANEKYLRETNVLYRTFLAIRNAIRDAFNSLNGDEERKKVEEQRDQLRQEEDQILESLRRREGDVADHFRRLGELRRQDAELATQQANDLASLLIRLEQGARAALRRIIEESGRQIIELGDRQYDLRDARIGKQRELQEAQTIADAEERKARVAQIEKEITDIEVGEAANRILLLGEAAQLLGARLSFVFADSEDQWKDAGKAILLTALDVLESLIPILSAQILSISLADPKSVATAGFWGIAQWVALTTIMEAAVLGAKAAVSGFKTGGPIKGGEQMIRVNEEGEEFVVKHGPAQRYRNLLDHINKGGNPIELPELQQMGMERLMANADTFVDALVARVSGVVRAKVAAGALPLGGLAVNMFGGIEPVTFGVGPGAPPPRDFRSIVEHQVTMANGAQARAMETLVDQFVGMDQRFERMEGRLNELQGFRDRDQRDAKTQNEIAKGVRRLARSKPRGGTYRI